MKQLLPLLLMLSLAGFCSCGSSPKDVHGIPAVAFTPLTEDDIARFVKLLPALKWHLAERGHAPSVELTLRDDVGRIVAVAVNRAGAADGVDSLLSAHGTNWKFCEAMLWRLTVCAWVCAIESGTAGFEENIRRQTSVTAARALRQRLEVMREVSQRVPDANMDAFRRHFRELRDFFEIVRFN